MTFADKPVIFFLQILRDSNHANHFLHAIHNSEDIYENISRETSIYLYL